MEKLPIKIIANYLPQFHRIPENDEWWGEGFTDWVAAKSAVPFYKWHSQPRRPIDDNYYDLSNVDSIKWQANLAKKYGIYGFGIYHYWFNSDQMLLQKPAELLRDSKDININYLFIWDNASWVRTWKKLSLSNSYAPAFDNKECNQNDSGILANLEYGNKKDWKKHFDYLLPFFKDDRYIKINNKPVFIFFNPQNSTETLKKMSKYWDELARNEGFDGVFAVSKKNKERKTISECSVLYEPAQSILSRETLVGRVYLKLRKEINKKLDRPNLYNYKRAWNRIIRYASQLADDNIYYSGFVSYDDTPRRGRIGSIIRGDTPELFEKYFTKLLQLSKEHGKEYVFLTAWNEWGEGAYLEPDTRYRTAYLEAVKRAVDNVNGREKV